MMHAQTRDLLKWYSKFVIFMSIPRLCWTNRELLQHNSYYMINGTTYWHPTSTQFKLRDKLYVVLRNAGEASFHRWYWVGHKKRKRWNSNDFIDNRILFLEHRCGNICWFSVHACYCHLTRFPHACQGFSCIGIIRLKLGSHKTTPQMTCPLVGCCELVFVTDLPRTGFVAGASFMNDGCLYS